MLWPPARIASIGLALCSGCDRLDALLGRDEPDPVDDAMAEDDGEAEPATTTGAEPITPPKKSTLSDTHALPPLERTRRRATFPAKGAGHLGFNLDAIDDVQAQDGAVEIPKWSVPGDGNVSTLRDDDLETGWHCEPTPYEPCAIGFQLTTPAELRAIRLYAAASGKAYETRARPAKVRVHTEQGWFAADLDDGARFAYILFGKPVETRWFAIEVLTYHGRKTGGMFVGELEVYGLGGTARGPLELDPTRMLTVVDGKPWSKGHDGQIRGPSFLEAIGADGRATRMLPGTAIYGRATDEIVLVESLAVTDCRTHSGMYYLLNRRTRTQVPIGDMGSMAGQVFRSKDGLGFVGGWVDEYDARVTGVVLEGDSYKHRRTQRLGDVTGPDFLTASGFELEPEVRGGVASNAALEGCTRGADDTLGVLRRAAGGKAEAKPGEWMVCDLGDGAQAFLTDHGPCGKGWEITVLDRAKKKVASKHAKRKGARVRVRRWSGAELLVEVGGSDDDVEVFRVGGDGVTPLGEVALATVPPSQCRNVCDDELVNNAEPR